MRTVYTFFISLCFLILGGIYNTYAGTRSDQTAHSTAINAAKSLAADFIQSSRNLAIIQESSADKSGTYTFSLNDNDEDESISARKYILQVKYFLTCFYAFVLCANYYYNKNRLPQCGYLAYSSSNKYLTQRVLRV